jgi:hypothetical protein
MKQLRIIWKTVGMLIFLLIIIGTTIEYSIYGIEPSNWTLFVTIVISVGLVLNNQEVKP